MIRAAAAALLTVLVLLSCGPPAPQTETGWYLGTTCSITLYDRVPRGLFRDVFSVVADVDVRMGVDKAGSELDAVNAAAGRQAVAVSGDIFAVVAAGLRYGELTAGAFDVTVGPLVALWDIKGDSHLVPAPADQAATRALVDYGAVELDPARPAIRLLREGMRLDLGGIAKGYAADRAVALLAEAGVKRALVDFGGNIHTLGRRSADRPWRIGVQDPLLRRGEYLGILEVSDRAVVTSGVYERYFERDGVRYHHILDPTTGAPARTGLLSVTVVAEKSTDADALSTGVFVLGPERGMALVRTLAGVEVVLVTEDRHVIVSPGLAESFQLTSADYAMAPR